MSFCCETASLRFRATAPAFLKALSQPSASLENLESQAKSFCNKFCCVRCALSKSAVSSFAGFVCKDLDSSPGKSWLVVSTPKHINQLGSLSQIGLNIKLHIWHHQLILDIFRHFKQFGNETDHECVCSAGFRMVLVVLKPASLNGSERPLRPSHSAEHNSHQNDSTSTSKYSKEV